MDLTHIREKLNRDLATRGVLEKQLTDANITLEKLRSSEVSLAKVQVLFQEAARMTQEKLEYHISTVVSSALAVIWEDPYTFEVEFVTKRGVREAQLWFIRDGEKYKPIESSGGGAIDIASFALKVAAWSINKTTRNILIIDEPFRNLSGNLQSKAAEMLCMISDKLSLQIILISHIEALVQNADKLFRVIHTRNKSVCEEITIDDLSW